MVPATLSRYRNAAVVFINICLSNKVPQNGADGSTSLTHPPNSTCPTCPTHVKLREFSKDGSRSLTRPPNSTRPTCPTRDPLRTLNRIDRVDAARDRDRGDGQTDVLLQVCTASNTNLRKGKLISQERVMKRGFGR